MGYVDNMYVPKDITRGKAKDIQCVDTFLSSVNNNEMNKVKN